MFPLYKTVSGSSMRKSGSASRLLTPCMKFRRESGCTAAPPENPKHNVGHTCCPYQTPGLIKAAQFFEQTAIIQGTDRVSLLLKRPLGARSGRLRVSCRLRSDHGALENFNAMDVAGFGMIKRPSYAGTQPNTKTVDGKPTSHAESLAGSEPSVRSRL